MSHAEVCRTVMLAAAALGQGAFVALYLFFPWWRSILGRVLFSTAVVILAVLVTATAGRIWDWPHEDDTFAVLYVLLTVVIWAQTFAFLQVLRHRNFKSRREDGEL